MNTPANPQDVNFKLVSHKPESDGKWSFTFANGQTLLLRETWDECLLQMPVEFVEPWLVKRYGFAFQFFGTFGSLIDYTKHDGKPVSR